jgi:hypothetical protein
MWYILNLTPSDVLERFPMVLRARRRTLALVQYFNNTAALMET